MNRGVTVGFVTILTLALFVGAVPGGAGVATASHDPESADFTVKPLGDRTPGATDVKYGQFVIGEAGTDFETLETLLAVYEEGSFEGCGPSNSETFGIDRGSTYDGQKVDESLESNVKSFSAGENRFEVEFYGEDDFGGSTTHLDDGDEIISVATCYTNPDEPGWYQITGSTMGVTASGERKTIKGESHYFWICDCESEAEAREQLGPPPSEPEPTATPKPTPEPTATPKPTPEPTATDGDSGGTDEDTSTTDADATPTPDGQTTDPTTPEPTATPTLEPTATPEPTVRPEPTPTPTEAEWESEVVQSPTAGDGAGFGGGVAVVALVGAVLLARRR
jgi:PGF-CTERM protein